MNGKNLHIILLLFITQTLLIANTGNGSEDSLLNNDVFGCRFFVENTGQYNIKETFSRKVFYALDNGLEKIYFTNVGPVYVLQKQIKLKEHALEAMENGKLPLHKQRIQSTLQMLWIGADTLRAKLKATDKQNHYFTHGFAAQNASAYKKLTYQNIYPHIDLEYIIPYDHDNGIKYSFVVHPGGNPQNIKGLYSGDIKKLSKSVSEEIHVYTSAAELVESAPISYDGQGKVVKSNWKLNGDTLGFWFPDGYDSASTLIIDPWVNSGVTMSSNNAAYDVDYDFAGNMYIYGGNNCTKVAKYSSAGTLLWTFSGTVTPINWISQPTSYVGNFGVDKFTGKCLVGQGQNPIGSTLIRLDANGNYDNFVTTANNQYQEIWDMGFTCLTGNVFTLGGGHLSNSSAATINTVNFTANLTTFQPQNTNGHQDISCHAIDDQGVVFVAYSTNGNNPLQNKLCKVGNGLGNQIWTQPNVFNTMVEVGNKSQYLLSPIYSNGFNCLAVNANYLFYYDGFNLGAYSKQTGQILASTNLFPQLVKRQGGIAVDDCNNLYLGGIGQINALHFNGSSFTALSSISLAVTTTMQSVFDIRLDKAHQLLYVCGSGFAGTYNAIHSNTCGVANSNCLFTQNPVNVVNSGNGCGSLQSASANVSGGIGPFTYSWIPSGQTGQTATGLASGMHTLVVQDSGANQTYITYVNILTVANLSFALAHSQSVACLGINNGTASISGISGGNGSYLINWTGNGYSATGYSVTGLTAGSYFVTITDSISGCSVNQMFSIHQSMPLFFNIVGNTNACVGSALTVTAVPVNGNAPYSYSWTNGSTLAHSTITSSVVSQQTLICTVIDNNGCQTSAFVLLNFIQPPTITSTSVSICPNEIASLTASGANTYTWNGLTTGSSFFISTNVNQTYTVVGTVNGCTAQALGYVTIKPVPSPSVSYNQPVCNGASLILSAEGGTAFTWSGPLGYTSTANSPTLSPVSLGHGGTYSVHITGANSCSVSASITVSILQEPVCTNFSLQACSNQPLFLSANVGANVLFYQWTGPLNFNSTTPIPCLLNPIPAASGVYTLQVASAEGCTNQAFAQVTVTGLPSFTPQISAPVCEGQSITLSESSNQGGLIFHWQGPSGFIASQSNHTFNPVQLSNSGTYTLHMTYGPCVGAETAALVVYANPQPTIVNQPRICELSGLHFQVFANAGNPLNTATWQGPNNFIAQGFQAPLPSSSFSSAGIYSVWVSDIHACSGFDTTLLFVMKRPTLQVFGDTVCLFSSPVIHVSGANTYTWYNQSGSFFNQAQVNLPPAQNLSTQSYTVIGTAINTCTNAGIATVLVNPVPSPTVFVFPSKPTCLNNPFTLSGSGANLFLWSGPQGFSGKGPSITFTPSSMSMGGTYSLTGYNQFGCSSTRTAAIVLYDMPHGQLVGDTLNGCAPFCSKFNFKPIDNELPISQIQWEIGRERIFSLAFDHCFKEAGSYPITCSFTSANGCSNTTSLLVSAWPKPVANFTFSPNRPVENQEAVKFTSIGESADTFLWEVNLPTNLESPNVGTAKYSGNEVTHLFTKEGIYAMALLVSNEKGCSDTIIKKILVEPDYSVYIPNCFTPNGDQINEEFGPVMTGIRKFELTIFNRWGEKLYGFSEVNRFWDGNFKGDPCKEDVYNYTLSILTRSGIEKHFSGHVTLLR